MKKWIEVTIPQQTFRYEVTDEVYDRLNALPGEEFDRATEFYVLHSLEKVQPGPYGASLEAGNVSEEWWK